MDASERKGEEILENARRRAPRLNYLLSLAMAQINAEKNGWTDGSDH